MDRYQAPGREHIRRIDGAPYVPLWAMQQAEARVREEQSHIRALEAKLAEVRAERDALVGRDIGEQAVLVIGAIRRREGER